MLVLVLLPCDARRRLLELVLTLLDSVLAAPTTAAVVVVVVLWAAPFTSSLVRLLRFMHVVPEELVY